MEAEAWASSQEFFLVLSELNGQALARCRLVCKSWSEAASSQTLWKEQCFHRWPSTTHLPIRDYQSFYAKRHLGYRAAEFSESLWRTQDRYHLLCDFVHLQGGQCLSTSLPLRAGTVQVPGPLVARHGLAWPLPEFDCQGLHCGGTGSVGSGWDLEACHVWQTDGRLVPLPTHHSSMRRTRRRGRPNK